VCLGEEKMVVKGKGEGQKERRGERFILQSLVDRLGSYLGIDVRKRRGRGEKKGGKGV